MKSITGVNKELSNLTCSKYFPSIPLWEINSILTGNGFYGLSDGIYCGRDGKIHEKVGFKEFLTLIWHKMEPSGNYEVIVYVS